MLSKVMLLLQQLLLGYSVAAAAVVRLCSCCSNCCWDEILWMCVGTFLKLFCLCFGELRVSFTQQFIVFRCCYCWNPECYFCNWMFGCACVKMVSDNRTKSSTMTVQPVDGCRLSSQGQPDNQNIAEIYTLYMLCAKCLCNVHRWWLQLT